ncbi:MAG: MMPL family transporter [archaeon]|nr:MMPL family transporter [archaeon]
MIFEKLANGITKHAKLVVLAWVVLLVAFAYPMSHVSESFSYDNTNVGSTGSEAMVGAEIMGEHFHSIVTTSASQNLLITFDPSVHSVDDMKVFDQKLSAKLYAYGKIESVTVPDPYPTGLSIMSIAYWNDMSSSDVTNDTGNLRNYIHKSIEEVATEMGAGWKASDFTTYVTGSPAISYDTMKSTSSDMSIVDPIAIFMVIVLVGLFFRSFVSSAAAPSVIGVALAVVLGILYFLGQVMSIASFSEIILIVSMLGAGCDYCIFILSRYREERRAGKDHIESCRQAIMWAGESVATSGMAVMFGFGAMSICSFGMVATMGIVLAIGIVIAIFAALFLMSSILVLVGDRLFWPTGAASPKLEKGYVRAFGKLAVRYFTVSTRFSIKHAKAIVVAVILFTVPMVYVYSTAHSSYDMVGSMMNGESSDGMVIMQDYLGGGTVMPNYIVFETAQPLAQITLMPLTEELSLGKLNWTDDSAYLTNVQTTLGGYATEIQSNEHIASASTLNASMNWTVISGMLIAGGLPVNTPLENGLDALAASNPQMTNMVGMLKAILTPEVKAAVGAMNPGMMWTISDATVTQIMDWFMFAATGQLGTTATAVPNVYTANFVRITINTREMALSDNSIATISKIADDIHHEADGNPLFAHIWASGTTAIMVELSDKIGGEFTKIELLAVVLIVLLLFFVMKSYVTPIRSVVTILMSVVWTVAITHLLFENVLGQGVLWLIPIVLLVICLGLGMDYDILLTTRIREYRFAKGMSNEESIEQAVLHSGSVITICGIIMGGTFGSLMLASTPMLQQMGFALCFAILVDALFIRTYVVPAAMYLLGDWNWKGPFKASKLKAESEPEQIQE